MRNAKCRQGRSEILVPPVEFFYKVARIVVCVRERRGRGIGDAEEERAFGEGL